VAGARILASAVVAGESLSELPCREAAAGENTRESLLDCYPARRLSALVTQRTGEAPVLARATSETDGSFSLEGLTPGRYSLWAESAEGTGLRRDVAAGDEGVELVLGEGVRMSGLVSNEEKGPVVGALVTAIFTAHSRFFETVTDGTGQFSLGPVPRGEYVLLVSKEGLLPAQVTFTAYARELERKFLLLRPRRISGQVVLAGAPAAGARVRTQSDEADSGLEVLTDAAGRFSLEGLEPTRRYELIATRDGLWANTYVDFEPEDDPPRFLAERTDITLELEPVVEVKGVVRDAAGRPIVNASVELSALDEEEEEEVEVGEDGEVLSLPPSILVASGWTDKEGRYHVGPARPGRMRLEVSAVGPWEPGFHDAAFKAGTSTVDFVLERSEGEEALVEEEAGPERPREPRPRLVGEVVDELGAPVSQAEVSLWPEASQGRGRHFDKVRTDARGHFSFEVSEGRYRLAAEFAQDDVAHTTSRVVELGKGETRVQLRFAPGQVLSGVVVDPRGQPIEDALVELRSTLRPEVFYHGIPLRTARSGHWTGPDGRFTYQSVSGEHLEVSVTKPDHGLACVEREGGRLGLPVKPGTRELRVVLVRDASVHGRFVQKDGSPITAFVVNGQGWRDEEGRFSVPIRCSGTLQLELRAADEGQVPGPRSVRHSVSVREEVDMDVGAIVLDGR
jgi:protocatechuate 3,4-dioxygenase beta subunit